MAETVTIAGKQFPKTYLYVGGAAVVGIVGYAWWTGGGGAPPVAEELPATDEFGDERITPNTIDTFDVAVDTRSGVKTNSEWKQAADAYLSGIGYDSTVVSTALGRFLAQQKLNKVDLEIARQAVASFGEPPEGRPWYILEEPPAPAPVAKPAVLAAPARVTATPSGKHRVRLTWTPVIGASGYRVRQNNPGVLPWRNVGLATTWEGVVLMGGPRDLRASWRVQTLGAGGKFGGNRTSNVVTIKF